MQQSVFTRTGTDRVLKFAFDLAQRRPRNLLNAATKSHGITITMPFWDERLVAVARDHPQVTYNKFHIDILRAHFVQHPDWLDVVGAAIAAHVESDLS